MRRQKSVVEQWSDQTYSRILVIENKPVKIIVKQTGTPLNPSLVISIFSNAKITVSLQNTVKANVAKMFGVDRDLKPFYKLAEGEPSISQLARQFKGLKPPRYPNLFEALTNAVACQQISLDAGIAILGRLINTHGRKFVDESGTAMAAFPCPEDLLDVDELEFKKLGFSYQKARSIKAIAFAAANEEIETYKLETLSNQSALDTLLKLRGIGRWSAEYVLLRGLGRLDIFPGDDVGGQNNLRQLLGLEVRPDYETIRNLMKAWQPYAGFMYFHLLLQKLNDKGVL